MGNFVGPTAFNESRSHFGAWAVVSAPLILGLNVSDKARLDAVWPILSNKEAIDINQLWSGHPGRFVMEGGPRFPKPWHCPGAGPDSWGKCCVDGQGNCSPHSPDCKSPECTVASWQLWAKAMPENINTAISTDAVIVPTLASIDRMRSPDYSTITAVP